VIDEQLRLNASFQLPQQSVAFITRRQAAACGTARHVGCRKRLVVDEIV